MFDLQPGVHLEEVEGAAVVDEELARAGAHVAGRRGDLERVRGHARPDIGPEARRRRLLEDLLMSSLDAAVALAEMDSRAVRVEQDLDLDVARPLDESLQHESVIAERGDRLPARRGERIAECLPGPHDPHPLAAATGRRLDEERQSDRVRGRDERRVGLVGIVVAGHDRDAETRGETARGRLVADGADRRGRRADPADVGGLDRGREVGALGEEAVARVDRVGAGAVGGGDHGIDVEQVDDRRALLTGNDGSDAHALGRLSDPSGDLPSVGHEHCLDGRSRPRFDGPVGGCCANERV